MWKKEWQLSSEKHLRICFPKTITWAFCWQRFIRYVYKNKVKFGHTLIVSQSILQYWASWFWVPVWETLGFLLFFSTARILLKSVDVSSASQMFAYGISNWQSKSKAHKNHNVLVLEHIQIMAFILQLLLNQQLQNNKALLEREQISNPNHSIFLLRQLQYFLKRWVNLWTLGLSILPLQNTHVDATESVRNIWS